ncbi:MAG TPA: hypothetical protein VGF60_12760 [Xanthobacteraceae bacterium]|jgi:hypothetical protein
MPRERSNLTDEDNRVVPFRPRSGSSGRGNRSWWLPRAVQRPPATPVEDLSEYEGGKDDDDYRHRMMVNLAALAITVVLAIAGGWLALQIAELRKTQDCALSGRRNCTPIDLKPLQR